MADHFEFIIEGPAVPLRAAKKSRRRYREWKSAVHTAALMSWSAQNAPTPSRMVEVLITNYYTAAPPDIDNIIKPILDALENIVYVDDSQVFRVTSTKVDLNSHPTLADPSPVLAEALVQFVEVVHGEVTW